MSGREHIFALRVFWEDTDAAGIVYYANYLKFMERGRSEMVRMAGLDQSALLDRDGVVFAVRRAKTHLIVSSHESRGSAPRDVQSCVETGLLGISGIRIEPQGCL